jgi:hypothetical protein
MGEWVKVSHNKPSAASTAPGNVTIVALAVISRELVAGVPHTKLGMTYTAPDPIGTFKGVRIYEERPDGSDPAYPTATASGDASGYPKPAFEPTEISKIPYRTGQEYQAVFTVPTPESITVCRYYAPSYSDSIDNQLVAADQAGATPSITITLAPEPVCISGEEYAKCVVLSGSPSVTQGMVGGVMQTRINQEFTAPTDDPRWYGVYCHVIYVDDEGNEQDNISVCQNSPTDNWFPTPRTVQKSKIRLLSYTRNGTDLVNTYVAGVTPETDVEIGIAPDPNAGIEYCANPTLGDITTRLAQQGDTLTRYVTVNFTLPDDPRCYGVYSRVKYVDDAGNTVENWSVAQSSPAEHWFPEPATAQTAEVDIVGYAVFNGTDQVNTVTAGVTPHGHASIGSGAPGDVTVVGVTASNATEGGVLLCKVYPHFHKPVDDLRWMGVQIGVTYVDDDGNTVTNWADVFGEELDGSEPSNWFPCPNTVQTATVTFYSYSTINGQNKINATGPSATVSIGTTGGSLDAGRLLESALKDTEFEIVVVDGKRVLQMKGVDLSKGFGGFEVGSAALPKMTISPDGTPVGWIGKDSVSGYAGAWFKRCYIGGTSPANAKIRADATGTLVIDGSVIVGTVPNASTVPATGVGMGTLPAGVVYAGTILCSQLGSGTLPVGVVYAGAINATQVNAGDFTGRKLTLNLNNVETRIGNDGFDGEYAGMTVTRTINSQKSAVFAGLMKLYNTAGTPTAVFSSGGANGGSLGLYSATTGFTVATLGAGPSGGELYATGRVQGKWFNANGVDVIDSNGTFIGTGVNCPLYGIAAAGFNPNAGGTQYYGRSGTFYDRDGNALIFRNGVLTTA